MRSSEQHDRPDRGRPRRVTRKSELSPTRRRLVEDMQDLGFGRYKKLMVKDREPVLDPPPKRQRNRRLHGGNHDRGEAQLDDFLLKDAVLELFDEMDRLGNGVIAELMVRNGLPYDITIDEPPQAQGLAPVR